jgi:hypothetical protein
MHTLRHTESQYEFPGVSRSGTGCACGHRRAAEPVYMRRVQAANSKRSDCARHSFASQVQLILGTEMHDCGFIDDGGEANHSTRTLPALLG